MVQNSGTCTPVSFSLPDILVNWPYEPLLHPNYGIVDLESTNWVNDSHLFSPKAQRSFDKSLFGLLGCLAFPLKSRAFCRAGCDLANIYFVIDEYNDVADPEAAVQVRDIVMDVLYNPYKARKQGDKLGLLMQGFWQRALALTMPGDASIGYFIKGFDIYMRSMIQEAEDRETKHVRTVNDYLQLRRETFGAHATMSFLSFGLGLPEQVLSHPIMQMVTLAAMNLLCIINDMHSYPVEVSRGIAFHNIITSIIHEHQVDIPAAMKWLEVFGRDTVAIFLTGINALPSWGPEIDDRVQQYMNDIGYIVRGTDTWCYRSERYWGEKGKEVGRTRIATLFLEQNQRGLLTKEELEAAMVPYS